ncbi:MAG: DUF922 domain-containing protein [bacterium]
MLRPYATPPASFTRRLRWSALAAVAGLGVACASAPSNPALDKFPPGVIGRTTVDYYDVQGRSFAELRAEMRRAGPKIADSSFVGETRSPMRWSWKTESSGPASCSIKDATVTVTAHILLPRWTPPADAEAGLVAEWERFTAALETHEAGHKDIAGKTAHDIAAGLRGLSTLCSQINTRASDIARVIVEKGDAQQKAYDAETRHGLTQGTSFGPRLLGGLLGGAMAGRAPDQIALLASPRTGTVRGVFRNSLDSAWSATPAAYAAAGLTVNATDSSAHAVGDSLTVRGTIAGTPLGEVVDCGVLTSGQVADSIAVTLFITSRLEATVPSGSTMTNTVQAFTRPAGAAAVACRSRGVLERRLMDALRSRLAAR